MSFILPVAADYLIRWAFAAGSALIGSLPPEL